MNGVTQFTLGNGLRVIHRYTPTTPMMALTVLYDTGARDEKPSLTGIAHLMEHLMFSGDMDGGCNYDDILETAGGTSNAWTSSDFTCFYSIVPSTNAATLFWLESERMRRPVFDQTGLDVQRSVVIEEYKQQCLNVPYGDTDHLIRHLAYTRHPYRWPVIGDDMAHLEKVTIEELRDFHYRLYTPANAVVAVTGNITVEECRSMAEKWLGNVPQRDFKPRSLAKESEINRARFAEVHGDVPFPMLLKAWLMPGYGEPGYFAHDAVTDILSNGRSSRFQQLLPKEPLLLDLDAAIYGSEEPGLLVVQARLADDSDATFEHANSLIEREIALLADKGPTEHEVRRAINKYASQQVFNDLHYARQGVTLALALIHGEDVDTALESYSRLTPAEIKEEASKLSPEASCTLRYRTL